MIIGAGIDLVEIDRIAESIRKYPHAFVSRIFTEYEQRTASVRIGNISQYYAGRWAAKEAFSKALGTGIGRHCRWVDIEIVSSAGGKPEVRLSGRGAEFANSLSITNIHLSISHTRHYVSAFVVLESNEKT